MPAIKKTMNKKSGREILKQSAGKLRSAIKDKKSAGRAGIIFLSVVIGTVLGIALDELEITLAVSIAVGVLAQAGIFDKKE